MIKVDNIVDFLKKQNLPLRLLELSSGLGTDELSIMKLINEDDGKTVIMLPTTENLEPGKRMNEILFWVKGLPLPKE